MKNSLINAYLEAKYVVLDNEFTSEFTVKAGLSSEGVNKLLEHFKTKYAVFITPENPFSEQLSKNENLIKHKEFLKVLSNHNLGFVLGYGTDELEEWSRESSYLIFINEISLSNRISFDFKQNAYIAIQKNKVAELFVLENNTYTNLGG
jgi:hypothetical protein